MTKQIKALDLRGRLLGGTGVASVRLPGVVDRRSLGWWIAASPGWSPYALKEVKRENTLAQLVDVAGAPRADSRREQLVQVAKLMVDLFELEKSGF